MKKLLYILFSVVFCFCVGSIASHFQSDSISNWYPTLIKPALTPPNLVFPIAWGILYMMMGVSIGLILGCACQKKKFLISLFAIQLFFNFSWSLLFFYFQNPLWGLADILLLDLLVMAFIVKSYSVKKISALLMIPYLLWLLFATYLNGYIWMYN